MKYAQIVGEDRMSRQDISLKDRFDLSKSPVLLNGTQALVRLMLMQKARDRAAGLNTAGYVTGYRGSPLGGVDQQMAREGKLLGENDIRFQPGLNEDLAATAITIDKSIEQNRLRRRKSCGVLYQIHSRPDARGRRQGLQDGRPWTGGHRRRRGP